MPTMMACTRAMSSARRLHTTIRASVAAEASSTPKLDTAQSLGFTEHKNRTRKLPTIDIPQQSTSRRNINVSGAGSSTSSRYGTQGQGHRNYDNPLYPRPNQLPTFSNRKPQPAYASVDKRISSDKPPRRDRPLKAASGVPSTDPESPDYFFASSLVEPIQSKGRRKPKNDMGISMEDLSASSEDPSLSTSSPRSSRSPRPRAPRSSNTARESRTPNNRLTAGTAVATQPARSGSMRKSRKREDRGKKEGVDVMPVRMSEKVEIPLDQSYKALFGTRSVASPSVRGAREIEASYWAKGMNTDTARQSDVLRLAGSYDLFKPTLPTKQVSPTKDAKQWGEVLLALNSSVGLRKIEGGREVLGKYLR